MSGDQSPGTARIDYEALIDDFLNSDQVRQNPRSITGVRTVKGRRYHLKCSERPIHDEIAGLGLANRVGVVSGVGGIELVAEDATRDVVITRAEVGDSLFNEFWNDTSFVGRWRGEQRDWLDLVSRVGNWLAVFHRESRQDPEQRKSGHVELCLEWLGRSLRSKLGRICRARPTLLSQREQRILLGFVDQSLASEGWQNEPIRRIHGDFSAVNQLVRPDGSIRIVDFGDSRLGFALEDVARFWSGLWELTQCGTRRARVLTPALAQFCAGYGLERESSGSPSFRVLRVWNAVTRIAAGCVDRGRYDLSTRWIQRRLQRSSIRWLREEIIEA